MNMIIQDIEIVKTISEKVIGRADVHFDWFTLKGFKILRDPKTSKEYVTPPSYQSKLGWRALFKTDLPKDWEEIQHQILTKFSQVQIEESLQEVSK